MIQDAVTNADAVAMLATTTGIAGIVFLLMTGIRTAVAAAWFDRWAPLLAMLIGVVLAFIGVIATVHPLTSTALAGALVSGLIGGALSQNVNTVVKRAVSPPEG